MILLLIVLVGACAGKPKKKGGGGGVPKDGPSENGKRDRKNNIGDDLSRIPGLGQPEGVLPNNDQSPLPGSGNAFSGDESFDATVDDQNQGEPEFPPVSAQNTPNGPIGGPIATPNGPISNSGFEDFSAPEANGSQPSDIKSAETPGSNPSVRRGRTGPVAPPVEERAVHSSRPLGRRSVRR